MSLQHIPFCDNCGGKHDYKDCPYKDDEPNEEEE